MNTTNIIKNAVGIAAIVFVVGLLAWLGDAFMPVDWRIVPAVGVLGIAFIGYVAWRNRG